MGTIINRDRECCATCIYWGGARNIVSYNEREVEINGDEGKCNAPGVNGLADTLSSSSCTYWKGI